LAFEVEFEPNDLAGAGRGCSEDCARDGRGFRRAFRTRVVAPSAGKLRSIRNASGEPKVSLLSVFAGGLATDANSTASQEANEPADGVSTGA
jgi:hypothetical protein